jgi:hypothetical protein
MCAPGHFTKTDLAPRLALISGSTIRELSPANGVHVYDLGTGMISDRGR